MVLLSQRQKLEYGFKPMFSARLANSLIEKLTVNEVTSYL